ncbi:MAG: HPr family phosphocarrier protein [Magnetococcales bacterium]|nr:HPr family phosphocarrier protein [Magnetococcales bacterium]
MKVKRKAVICNRLGMHTRAASMFAMASSRFESKIGIRKGKVKADGKSIMDVMMLAAAKGDTVTISAEGGDAKEALETLCKLVEARFNEGRKAP